MKLSDIFSEKPQTWGLKGDPYFWEHLKSKSADINSLSPNELEAWIKKEHLLLSGEEMTGESIVKVQEFAHEGMSSGGISGSWWTETGIPLLKSRLNGEPENFILISFSRRSVCMGDDADAGKYTLRIPESATLYELMSIVLRGGNGNGWPIPFTGADSYWIINSNIGDIAKIYTDSSGGWHIDCIGFNEQTPVKKLGISWLFGDRI